MKSYLHTGLLIAAVISAYIWQLHPALKEFAPQAFAVACLAYFLIKRIDNGKLWHIAPRFLSLEMALATFAFLMLIGSTGNTGSIFFPLSYLHLFFLVIAVSVPAAVITTFGVVLFHFAAGTTLDIRDLAELSSLPILLVPFLFTKKQYIEAQANQFKAKAEKILLDQEDDDLLKVIEQSCRPKLESLKDLFLAIPNDEDQQLLKQIKDKGQEINQGLQADVDTIEQKIKNYRSAAERIL